MKDKSITSLERCAIIILCILSTSFASAKKKEIITVKEGDPLILLQEKKTAIFEIDYSQMMVTDGKDHDYDLVFSEWMIAQDEDDDEWTKDWVKKDSVECNQAFRDNFNDEIKHGMKLTKIGKDYKVILRFSMINFGKKRSVANKVAGVFLGGVSTLMSNAVASGELEVRDLKTGEVKLVLAFNDLVGEEAYTQVTRFKGIFENLCEQINDFLKDYQKKQKKQQNKESE